MQRQQHYPKRRAQLYFFLFFLLALPHFAICVFCPKSTQQPLTPANQQLFLSNQTMSTASLRHQHHHHNLRRHYRAPCAVVKEEDPADLDSDASPTASASREEFRFDAVYCDCGMLTGCRCSDPICDMVCTRVDESEMEEGMDDQGYRQHV